MATLQKIRNRGPLLVAVIGIALFAFVAGDAWKAIQPHQGRQDIGEVNGEAVSAQDYQALVDEYTEVIKMTQGTNALNDDQLTQVKDQVWQSYVNNKLIEAEAEKLGLKVSDAEIQDVIEQGVHPLLMQTPFRNPQTGAFDKDMLKKFLVEYANLGSTAAQLPAQYVEYYQQMGAFWNFIEKTLKQSLLAEKYQSLIAKSLISNPVAAEDAFASRTQQADALVAAIPYSSVNDSTITVSNDEIKALYNKKKEAYKQLMETRNIKYIDVLVTPSEADRAELLNEVTEYANQLATVTDMANFIRSTGSAIPFTEVAINKAVYPSDIATRIDSVKIGEVYGPYYNQADDSYNAMKVMAKEAIADSIQFRQIQVYAETADKTKTLADSIYTALKGGADFAEIAQVYVSKEDSKIFRAEKELRGFKKVFLKAGEEKEVEIELSKRAFAFYNVEIHDWHVESGKYNILVGASSRDIRLTTEINVTSTITAEVPDMKAMYPAYANADVKNITDEQFEKLLGFPIPQKDVVCYPNLTIANTLEDSCQGKNGKKIVGLIIDEIVLQIVFLFIIKMF